MVGFFRILFLMLTPALLVASIFWELPFYWPLLLGMILILQLLEFVRWQRKLENQIWQFFRSIRNGDHAFVYKKDNGNRIVDHIHDEMNRLNQEVKELKINLEARERYYQILLEKASTGIITINQQGFVELTNQAALQMLGITVLNHINQLERVDLKLYSHIKQQVPKERILITRKSDDGSHDISVITQQIKVREDDLYVVILQDIRNELDQKELESWIRLIRVQAHEIRNSLAPIVSVAQVLLAKTEDQELKEGLELILERSSHLQDFVETYRQLTHLPNPALSTFDVCSLTDRVKILLSDLENYQDVRLSVECEQNEIWIRADKNQLTQVFLNLLRNAFEAVKEQANPEIHIHLNQNNEHTTIDISDNGLGVPEDIREDIFIPFFTTKEKGTGVGLSLSKQIIRKHGGDIVLVGNSKKGGARFIITLPK